MRRRLLNLAVALSLILCVATISLWVRSYFMYDLWIARPWGTYSSAESWRGDITISHVRNRPHLSLSGREQMWRWRGFRLGRGPIRFYPARHASEPATEYSGPYSDGYTVGAPHWFIVLMSVVLPARRLWTRLRTRTNRGLCPSCGYDLRATPDRCPECGAEVKQPKAAEGAAA